MNPANWHFSGFGHPGTRPNHAAKASAVTPPPQVRCRVDRRPPPTCCHAESRRTPSWCQDAGVGLGTVSSLAWRASVRLQTHAWGKAEACEASAARLGCPPMPGRSRASAPAQLRSQGFSRKPWHNRTQHGRSVVLGKQCHRPPNPRRRLPVCYSVPPHPSPAIIHLRSGKNVHPTGFLWGLDEAPWHPHSRDTARSPRRQAPPAPPSVCRAV